MAESKKCKLKWFDSKKGYGFLIVEGHDSDIFVHIKQIRTSGFGVISESGTAYFTDKAGAKLVDTVPMVCVVEDGAKGLHAVNISRTDIPPILRM